MPITPVQVPSARSKDRKPSLMEQIAMGVDIASKVLGTGVNAYEMFGIKKPAAEQDARLKDAQTKYYEAQARDYGGTKALQDEKTRAEIEYYKNSKPLELEKTRAEIKKLERNPGEVAADESIGKEFVEFTQNGGASQFEKNMQQLREARNILAQKKDVTGGVAGVLSSMAPGAVADYMNPELAAVRDMILEPAQGNLRMTLGPAFTEKEGAKVEARTFNPALKPSENIKKIDRFMNQLQSSFDQKMEAFKYYQENGTLKGFKNKLPSIGDLDNILPKETKEDLKNFNANTKAQESETVTVVSPEGVVGTMPKSKLNEALKRGFKVQ